MCIFVNCICLACIVVILCVLLLSCVYCCHLACIVVILRVLSSSCVYCRHLACIVVILRVLSSSCVYCCHLACIVVILRVLLSSYLYLLYLTYFCCTLCAFVVLCLYCCSYLNAGLLARNQYPEGPATGHLDKGFSWFPCVYKRMLRWFPSFQVATTCLSCSPPDLNFLVTFFYIYICVHVK